MISVPWNCCLDSLFCIREMKLGVNAGYQPPKNQTLTGLLPKYRLFYGAMALTYFPELFLDHRISRLPTLNWLVAPVSPTIKAPGLQEAHVFSD